MGAAPFARTFAYSAVSLGASTSVHAIASSASRTWCPDFGVKNHGFTLRCKNQWFSPRANSEPGCRGSHTRASPMADDELCLADYDELDAAKQDHVLALIHQGASGNVAGRAVGWAGGPWLALGFPAAAPQQSPTAGEHGGSASQPVTTGMTRRPLPAAPRSLRGPPETRVPDSDQNAARQLEEVGRAPRASHDNVTDVAAPGGGDAARRPAERQRRARASPPPEKNIHVLPRSLSRSFLLPAP